jgi:D-alanyl-D-alanine carboxypeptidase
MTRTTFRNASGLHNPQQVTTARDMAKLARYLIKRYPQYYTYFSTREFSYRGASFHNHNRLMDRYKGMDGLKTGFIGQSGFNLVASAVRDNHRLIGVVFGGRTAASRDAHMAQLLDDGFKQVVDIRVAAAPVPARKPDSIAQLAAAYNSTDPATGDDVSAADEAAEEARFAALNPIMQNRTFSNLIGEGDSDPAVSRRLETGLKAIAAVRGEQRHGDTTGVQIASLGSAATAPAARPRPWAIQIGAFESRARTDVALRAAMAKLPAELAQGAPFIAPLKTGDSWLFRARLGGYSKEQAMAACKVLKDCLPVAPQAY